MKNCKVSFDRVWPGHPFLVKKNEYVKIQLQPGTQLKKLVQGDWISCNTPSANTKHTVDTLYKIDCVEFTEAIDCTWSIDTSPIEA